MVKATKELKGVSLLLSDDDNKTVLAGQWTLAFVIISMFLTNYILFETHNCASFFYGHIFSLFSWWRDGNIEGALVCVRSGVLRI